MSKFFGNGIYRARLLLAPDPDPGGGGGKKEEPPADPRDKAIADLTARLAALEGKKEDPPNPDDKDLAEKARLEREAKAKAAGDSKTLEGALKFNLSVKEWAKSNSSLLPKTIEGILEAADKVNYDSAIDRSNDVKVGIVSEFFAVQANLDLLTPSQKATLEEFQKLTKNGKQERVQQLYDMVFEPALETLKKVTKAQQLNNGHGSATDVENGYKKRLLEGSEKHYLGGKKNA